MRKKKHVDPTFEYILKASPEALLAAALASVGLVVAVLLFLGSRHIPMEKPCHNKYDWGVKDLRREDYHRHGIHKHKRHE